MQTLPKHTERSQVTPRINSERCNVETKSENSYALNSQNSWQMKLKENSTLKQNVHYIRADTRGVIWKARPGLSVTQKKKSDFVGRVCETGCDSGSKTPSGGSFKLSKPDKMCGSLLVLGWISTAEMTHCLEKEAQWRTDGISSGEVELQLASGGSLSPIMAPWEFGIKSDTISRCDVIAMPLGLKCTNTRVNGAWSRTEGEMKKWCR